jgi:formylglycine-generating enzyme required for sulfatase activity
MPIPFFRIGNKKLILCLAYFAVVSSTYWITAYSQHITNIDRGPGPGLSVSQALISDSSVLQINGQRPLYSFYCDEKKFSSLQADPVSTDSSSVQYFENGITVNIIPRGHMEKGWRCELVFTNNSSDTVAISNVLPFGTENTTAYITGSGPWNLARAYLFRPDSEKLRVILPDNAWELGYVSFNAGDYSVCALARRQQTKGGQKKRYETSLPPGAEVRYLLYADLFKGEWQSGLKLMFRDRYLYDLDSFDNTLFERQDLRWIKESYLIVLQMAWDREFFDRSTGRYTYSEELRKWNEQFGYIDVFGIWPTWPRLGLDQRNQWDMYRTLPGGTAQLRTFARMSRQYNTRFFIAYNPWDNSTRKEDHYRGMARLISEVEADGVVLDTRGSSSYELQAAADSVRRGVVMFSEGMAVTRDMPGIIAGRVHNALYFSPELNLNKLIKPDFSIFRVCDVGEDNNHREIAVAFFNGYGTELNMFRPGGRDDKYRSDLDFLAATTFILRQNNDAFLDNDWTPLIPALKDRVYVNRWKSGSKTLYTVLSMKPEGINEKLFRTDTAGGIHFVSLWHHENIVPEAVNGELYLRVKAPGWDPALTGTRQEASVDCIAGFPDLLKTKLSDDSVTIRNPGNGRVVIWKGNPSVSGQKFELALRSDTTFRISNLLGQYEGKIVIQYLEGNRLKDENIAELKGGKPWLISRIERTSLETSSREDMVIVPGGSITFTYTTNEDFMPYPGINTPVTTVIDSFMIDKYPVTNQQYYDFLVSSGYVPADTSNFLRHWDNGTFRPGQEKYPVVYVSREDMVAYARWAGKRLPSQAEWQLAAQGTDGRKWPWGDEFYGTRCNNGFDRPTPVDAFVKGGSPYGVLDLVGNVWQATNDMYFNGTNYFMIIRGGSYYKPDSSWWYIQGGPQQLDRTQILLMVSQGFDRSATVGFRCVKDIEPGVFRVKEKRHR